MWANLGSTVEPRIVTRIEDANGRVVLQRGPNVPQSVIDPRIAFIVRDMMRDAAERGTGTAARKAVPASIPVAGKTGTTNDNVDVWFMGMTPDLVAGVWLGFDRPEDDHAGRRRRLARGADLGRDDGELLCGARRPPAWTPPVGLVTAELDRATGLLADSTTPPERRYTEYFVPGTEPEPLRSVPWKVPVFRGVSAVTSRGTAEAMRTPRSPQVYSRVATAIARAKRGYR